MKNKEGQITLTFSTIFIEDKKGRGYSGYLAEFPELMAQGETKEDVEQKLFSSLNEILKHKKGQAMFNKPVNAEVDTINLVSA